MTNKKNITADLILYNGIKNLVVTYTEIAASRIQKIRNSVLRNRTFMEEIDKIYEELKHSYQIELSRLLHQPIANGALPSLVQKNGKTALVLMAANSGLYGDILRKVFDYFWTWNERYEANIADLIIVGNRGKNFLEEKVQNSEIKGKKITYFNFPDDNFDPELFKNMLNSLVNYQNVLVFYGLFESIGSQVAMMTSLNGNTLVIKQEQHEKIEYFFEPSVKDILAFFETEIFTSLLVQTLHESQLAKYASRMVYLDRATEKIKEELKKTHLQQLHLGRRLMNSKQQETISGISLWG